MDTETKILSARTALMWDHPFFGALAVQLMLEEDSDGAICKTMATDSRRLIYYPPFVDKLSREELVFVIAHEIMHNASMHHTRRGDRQHRRFNIAADFAINVELQDYADEIQKTKNLKRPPMVMPQGGLLDRKYTGLGAEEIYRLLDDEDEDGGQGTGQPGAGERNDPGGCGEVLDACGQHDEAAKAAAEAEMTVKIRQAASIAKAANAGSLPGALQRIVDQLLQPKVDWRQVFRRFIDQSQNRDYSWSRPNRRFLQMGYVLPSLVSDGVSHIVFAVDTSGSITKDMLDAFAAEINGAFGDGAIDKVTVIYADAAVQGHDEYETGDVVDLRMLGGGGTAFADTFEWVRENASDARAVVYLTDLYVTDFGDEPDCPVLWAVPGDPREFQNVSSRTPFGEAIHLEA
ncbi:hypothetical protein H9Q09_00990 [Aurantimonas sp. DM33-3]|uniref:vWA domain-containing protein n=1 Tax=Aurantimonas sp. DM33-3 TaxID=2766955 RepID=UPI001652460E|nr:VWA-like domain-containing protein [Aurantimonas sp. DM33-3]MBC6714760.1 hypothetical protein [Aurantimonas sp. DM33-3]